MAKVPLMRPFAKESSSMFFRRETNVVQAFSRLGPSFPKIEQKSFSSLGSKRR